LFVDLGDALLPLKSDWNWVLTEARRTHLTTFRPYVVKVHFYMNLSTPTFPSGCFPPVFLSETLQVQVSYMRATFPAHTFHIDLITLDIFAENTSLEALRYKYHLLQHVTFFPLGPNIFVSILFSNILTIRHILTCRSKWDTH
jgi:hypothetical protein